jgi:hypothetical protein
MHAALHPRYRDISNFADYQLARVTYSRGLRVVWNFFVRNSYGIREFVSEGAQPRAENQRDTWAQLRFRQDKSRSARGL